MAAAPLLGGRYKHVAVVGKGGFGIVGKHIDLITGEHVAVKTIPSRFVNQESARLVREIDILSFLYDAHPHVIGYLSMFATPSKGDNTLSQDGISADGTTLDCAAERFNVAGPYYSNLSYGEKPLKHHSEILSMVKSLSEDNEFNLHIVMPLMSGNLLYFINLASPSSNSLAMPNEFVELVTVVFAFQICFGLDFLHRCNIVHRDIKPENILVRLHSTNPYESTALIADFGLARDPQASDTFYVCTRYYRPPEVVTNVSRGETSIDVWSLGCVFFEMVTGNALFSVDSALNSQGVWDGQLASTQLEVILDIVGTPSHDDIRRFMPVGNAQNYLLRSTPRPSLLVEIMNQQWRLVTTPDRREKWIDLICRCLSFFPQKRPTCEDLCRHELFQDYNLLYGENVTQPEAKQYRSAEVSTLKRKNKQIVLQLVQDALQKSLPGVDASFSDGTECEEDDSGEGEPHTLREKQPGGHESMSDEQNERTAESAGAGVSQLSENLELQEQYDNWIGPGMTRDEALGKILGDLQRYTHDVARSEQLRGLLKYITSTR